MRRARNAFSRWSRGFGAVVDKTRLVTIRDLICAAARGVWYEATRDSDRHFRLGGDRCGLRPDAGPAAGVGAYASLGGGPARGQLDAVQRRGAAHRSPHSHALRRVGGRRNEGCKDLFSALSGSTRHPHRAAAREAWDGPTKGSSPTFESPRTARAARWRRGFNPRMPGTSFPIDGTNPRTGAIEPGGLYDQLLEGSTLSALVPLLPDRFGEYTIHLDGFAPLLRELWEHEGRSTGD